MQIMQCIYTTWTPPLSKLTSTKSKLSTGNIQTQIHINKDDDVGVDDDSVGEKFRLPSNLKSITSTSNPFVKHCLKLRHSSYYRHSHGSVLVVGTTPIREIYKFERSLQERTVRIDCLLLLDKAEVPEGLDDISNFTLRISPMVMKKLSGLQSIESIEAIALMKIPATFFNINVNQKDTDCRSWFPSPHRILVLDGIQDPGNLGTLLRSAMAFKWGGVFLLPGCCDPFNEKALRASRGACFQLSIVSGSWCHLEALKDEFQMKLLAGHPESNEEARRVLRLSQGLVESLADVPLCLVLGSEGHGLSEKSERLCELVSIQMAGGFESLNVSVAGGIFLYMLQPKKQRISHQE
ncbi:hypothetical protein LWI29_006528 [Acer saccharum]|uniref:tRNA/rRNA methyltransferase SpoU type domain-containing protein n=1 Tax=Acer saccharum TaxID=4024 RepID=A0AA39T323_ACESA|nr:hypothetical protein LWI29_006528 [Acer saccharum]